MSPIGRIFFKLPVSCDSTFVSRQHIQFTDLVPARNLPTRNCLYNIGHHGDRDEETGDIIKDEGGGGGVRVLKGAPHSFSQCFQDNVT